MRSSIKVLLLAGICAVSVVFAGCGEDNGSSSKADSASSAVTTAAESSVSEAETTEESSSESAEVQADGLWADAVYKEDTELGEGKTTVKIEVKAEDKSVTITVHTDKDNLGAALTENKLVEGDQSEYGLYIKVVNGIKADYDTDKAYWAISKDGEMTPTGADSTKIADGEHYELTYTKG